MGIFIHSIFVINNVDVVWRDVITIWLPLERFNDLTCVVIYVTFRIFICDLICVCKYNSYIWLELLLSDFVVDFFLTTGEEILLEFVGS